MIMKTEKLLREAGIQEPLQARPEDLKMAISELKQEKNAVILAHFYQDGNIQEVADFVGDSLALAQKAAETDSDIIVFAGVHFMAETAKIMNPTKKVLLPDLNAGCSLATSCPPVDFKKFIDQYPGHLVVSYINCSAEIKAMSDLICTSSNALAIINSIPEYQPIIFAPDVHLGKYLKKITGREMVLWNGACEVHEAFSKEKILNILKVHPDAKVIAHPECAEHVLDIADFIGSTNKLLDFVGRDKSDEFIVVTEAGILHEMRRKYHHKKFYPAPLARYTQCACGECPYMKLTTLEKLYLCLNFEQPEIKMEESLRLRALKPLERMFNLS